MTENIFYKLYTVVENYYNQNLKKKGNSNLKFLPWAKAKVSGSSYNIWNKIHKTVKILLFCMHTFIS